MAIFFGGKQLRAPTTTRASEGERASERERKSQITTRPVPGPYAFGVSHRTLTISYCCFVFFFFSSSFSHHVRHTLADANVLLTFTDTPESDARRPRMSEEHAEKTLKLWK